MLNTIVVPTDFSPTADVAVSYAFHLVSANQGKIILHHALDPGTGGRKFPDGSASGINQMVDDELQAIRERFSHLLKDSGVNVEVDIRAGELDDTLEDLVRNQDVDMVVMYTTGVMGRLEQLIKGSNALRLFEELSIPLLVIPENYSFTAPDTILWSSDYHEKSSDYPLSVVKACAQRLNSAVKVMHVQTPDDRPEYEGAVVSQHEGDFFRPEVKVTYKTMYKDGIEKGIVACMEEFPEVGMVAVVSREHNFIERKLHKGVSAGLASHPPCPLLLMKEKG